MSARAFALFTVLFAGCNGILGLDEVDLRQPHDGGGGSGATAAQGGGGAMDTNGAGATGGAGGGAGGGDGGSGEGGAMLPNHLKNPSFENGTTYWGLDGPATYESVVAPDAPDGTHVLIESSTVTTGEPATVVTQLGFAPSITEGCLRLRAKAKRESGNGVASMTLVINGLGVTSLDLPGGATFAEASVTCQILDPANTFTVYIDVETTPPGPLFSFAIDDLHLEEVACSGGEPICTQ